MSVLEQVEQSTAVIEVPWSTLKTLATVSASAATDDARPLLTQIHLREMGGVLVAEATDSYSLARITSGVVAPVGLDVLVPAKWLSKSISALKVGRMASYPITLSFTGDIVTVSNSITTLSTTVAEGKFPSVDQIIPTEARYTSELGAFNALFLARMADILPAETKRNRSTWKCVSMSATSPSVWTKIDGDLSALFLLMPVRI